MTDTLPQIRVRADTQSRDAAVKAEAQARLPAKDSSNYSGSSRVNGPDNTEGAQSQLDAFSAPDHYCILQITHSEALARTLPLGKSYPSRFIPTLSVNQPNAASKAATAEARRDSQAIDPLSDVCG